MTERTIGGIKISGDLHSGRAFVRQRPEYELVPLISALLYNPNVVSFGWEQYTPYFNDGDPCEFSAHSLWVKTVWDTKPTEDDEYADEENEYGLEYGDGVIGKHEWDRSASGYAKIYANTDPLVQVVRAAAEDLDNAIQSGAFDQILLEKFGDHARIRTTKDGFEVETYEHD